LGFRFRDLATQQVVGSGLRVQATPLDAPPGTRPVRGQANRSGVWLFYGLPRLRTFELGTEDLIELASPPGPPQFRIEVEDEDGRFLPGTFVARVSRTGPMEFRSHLSPPLDVWDVPLFSAPARSVPTGCAVIRANLVTRSPGGSDKPARWALLQATATVRNRPIQALGLTDEKGDVAMMFPWPEVVGLAVTLSPPGGSRPEAPVWDFKLAAWHDPGVAEAGFADVDAVFARLDRTPDRLWTPGSPPEEFQRATLTYGRELVVPELSTLSPPAAPFDSGPVSRSLIVTN